MLTGDNARTGRGVGRTVGVSQVFAEMLPGDKVDKVRVFGQGRRAGCARQCLGALAVPGLSALGAEGSAPRLLKSSSEGRGV